MPSKKQDKSREPSQKTDGGTTRPGAASVPTSEERIALFALGYDAALAALEKEESVAVAVATEYILDYSEKVGFLLKEGRDYLDLLTPAADTPAIERIAMAVVLEAVEEELAEED